MSITLISGLHDSNLCVDYARSSTTSSQPKRFLDMPSEIRVKIYGFVIGVGKRIRINIDMNGVFDAQVVCL